MSLAQVERIAPVATPAPMPAGGVHFAPASRQAEICTDLRTRRYLVVPVTPPDRGRLRLAIDDAVEGALALRGALPPAAPQDAALEPTVRDQVFRARALGAAGLVLALPRLAEEGSDVLEAEDGITLSTWLSASRRAPLLVMLDERDRATRVLAPVPIGDLAGPIPAPRADSMPPASGEVETATSPEAVPPPPVLAMPRRGVMKKRSLRLDGAAPEVAQTPQAPVTVVATEPAAHVPVEEDLAPAPEPAGEVAARRVVDAAAWRQHAIDLDRARGPKPVAVIERLFGTRYMPLLGALAHGEADGAVRAVVDAWRQSFEHSYKEAFAALRVTGKRPPMVFDAPEIAARVARLNGARGVKLVLVDAMRFDVAERVGDRLKDALAGRAVCVERTLLWSALPTTTPTQLALLARGPDGLNAEPSSEPEPEIVRGRAVGTLRRERAGSREIMKLDLVEARLRSPGPAHDDRIDALAAEVAPILVKYVETLPPRTLLFLFGDHGFRMPASLDGRATGPATQGGVSPEEVLVPAQAWLVGGVH
jgi:hypothetical protein